MRLRRTGIAALSLMLLLPTMAREQKTAEYPAPGKTTRITALSNNVGAVVYFSVPNIARQKDGSYKPSAARLRMTCKDMVSENHHYAMGANLKEYKDCVLNFFIHGIGRGVYGFNRSYFIRPDAHHYYAKEKEAVLAKWDSYRPASTYEVQVDLVRVSRNRLEIWIDGRFYQYVKANPQAPTVKIDLQKGATIVNKKTFENKASKVYLPMNVRGTSFKFDEKYKLPFSGMQKFGKVPVRAFDRNQGLDLSKSRWLMQENKWLDNAFYLPFEKRSAWDSVPESPIMSIPKGNYSYAHVLCTSVPQKDTHPEMTVRVVRKRLRWDGTGNAYGETRVRIDPADSLGCEKLTKVGTTKILVNGRSIEQPVYLASIPLQTASLAGFINQETDNPAIDLEFVHEMKTRVSVSNGVFGRLPVGKRSNLRILGVTLEKAPVEIFVTSAVSGNIFEKGADKPELLIKTRNPSRKQIRFNLEATFKDFDGKTNVVKRTITAQPGKGVSRFSVASFENGWYEAVFNFKDDSGRSLWRQPIALAILPQDRRVAGSESPYGIWWFGGQNETEPDARKVMPIIKKMGVRHINPGTSPIPNKQRDIPNFRTPEFYKKYGVSVSMVPFERKIGVNKKTGQAGLYHKTKGLSLDQEDFDTMIPKMKEWRKAYPDVKWAMIYHEHHIPGDQMGIAPEFLGLGKLKREGVNDIARKNMLKATERYARMLRKAIPDIKIMIGNSATNFGLNFLRNQFDQGLWDAMGFEAPCQLFPPESQPNGYNLLSFWFAKEMAKKYKMDKIKINSCYEFIYRNTSPGALSLMQQADWYIRDILISHAYGLTSINPGLLEDCDNSYYYSRWGASGYCFREPLLMPKPSYVAMATLTSVLDRAKYQRYLSTGSRSFFCLEFKRGGKYVYALWSGKGDRQVTLPLGPGCRTINIMGVGKDVSGSTTMTIGESTVYIESSMKLTGLKLGAVRHAPVSFKDAKVISKMAAADWKTGSKSAVENFCPYVPVRFSPVDVSTGAEGTKFTLKPNPSMPDVIGRMAVIEPKNGPIPIDGRPDAIGIWVKGNSSWARIFFELEDAKGRSWVSNGWDENPGTPTWEMADWRRASCVSFDGWNFIAQSLPQHYESGQYAPSFRHWRCMGDNNKDNKIAFPIKFSRLHVVMREKQVYVTDMVPADSPEIVIKDLTVGSNKSLVVK